MATVFSVLTLYSWALVGALIYCLYQIARFYQAKYAELYPENIVQDGQGSLEDDEGTGKATGGESAVSR